MNRYCWLALLAALALAVAIGCGDSEDDDDSSEGGGGTGGGSATIRGGTAGVDGATGGGSGTGQTGGNGGASAAGGSVGTGGSAAGETFWECAGEVGNYCSCFETTEQPQQPACVSQYPCCYHVDLRVDTCTCPGPVDDCEAEAAQHYGVVVPACPPT